MFWEFSVTEPMFKNIVVVYWVTKRLLTVSDFQTTHLFANSEKLNIHFFVSTLQNGVNLLVDLRIDPVPVHEKVVLYDEKW